MQKAAGIWLDLKIISRYGGAHRPCPLDLIAPPELRLKHCSPCTVAHGDVGEVAVGGFYLPYLPEQLPLRVEDPGSLEVPERNMTARMGQHLDNNTRRASPVQLQSRIMQLPHGWRELPEEREDDKLQPCSTETISSTWSAQQKNVQTTRQATAAFARSEKFPLPGLPLVLET